MVNAYKGIFEVPLITAQTIQFSKLIILFHNNASIKASKIVDQPVAGCVGGRNVNEIGAQGSQVIAPRPSFDPPGLGATQQLVLAFFGQAFLRETSSHITERKSPKFS